MRKLFGITTVIGAAILASACCILPIAVAVIGIGGSTLALAGALAPWRPVFVLISLAALAFGWWRVRPAAAHCADGTCTPGDWRRSRWIMGVVTIIAVPLLAFPELAAWASNTSASVSERPTTTLSVTGMTCEACPVNVRAALVGVPGVRKATVTLTPPIAKVWADDTVSTDRLIAAVKESGYGATVLSSSSRQR